jgi:hypothetical protein
MRRILILVFALAVILTGTSIFAGIGLYHLKSQIESSVDTSDYTINAVIGDESYVQLYGETPGDGLSDYTRIRTHLDYVESGLRERSTDHLTKEQKKNRMAYLDLLTEYYKAGQFPYNDGHEDPRRPVFIDETGNICAVGYLVQQSAGRELAESISKEFKYAFIPEIESTEFDLWAEQSGFTPEELAMIQPMYGTIEYVVEEKEVNRNKVDWQYGTASTALTVANAVYMSNRASRPWLFNSSSAAHWFGLAAGTGSLLLGALNVDNRTTYTEILGEPGFCMGNCTIPVLEYHEVNHARTGLSLLNISAGLFTVIRSGYHLLSDRSGPEPSKTELDLTHIQAGNGQTVEPVPALQFRINF